jgi:hypothetical protein
MLAKVDYKEIQSIINEFCQAGQEVTEAEATEAFHNLVGYVNLLIQINNEVQLVPLHIGKK